MTRPASSLTPASYAHGWAGTRRALLTCWRGVRQVGLVRIRTHPPRHNNQLHEITLNAKASGFPWREHALVRLRFDPRDAEEWCMRLVSSSTPPTRPAPSPATADRGAPRSPTAAHGRAPSPVPCCQ